MYITSLRRPRDQRWKRPDRQAGQTDQEAIRELHPNRTHPLRHVSTTQLHPRRRNHRLHYPPGEAERA